MDDSSASALALVLLLARSRHDVTSISLRAHRRLVRMSRARWTVAKEPLPRQRPISKLLAIAARSRLLVAIFVAVAETETVKVKVKVINYGRIDAC